jgi:hypothetical protein
MVSVQHAEARSTIKESYGRGRLQSPDLGDQLSRQVAVVRAMAERPITVIAEARVNIITVPGRIIKMPSQHKIIRSQRGLLITGATAIITATGVTVITIATIRSARILPHGAPTVAPLMEAVVHEAILQHRRLVEAMAEPEAEINR